MPCKSKGEFEYTIVELGSTELLVFLLAQLEFKQPNNNTMTQERTSVWWCIFIVISNGEIEWHIAGGNDMEERDGSKNRELSFALQFFFAEALHLPPKPRTH